MGAGLEQTMKLFAEGLPALTGAEDGDAAADPMPCCKRGRVGAGQMLCCATAPSSRLCFGS